MTQAELAKRLGVGTTSVSNWCKGLKSPRMDKVDRMCEIFDCRRSDLMEDIPVNSFERLRLTPDETALIKKYSQLNTVGKGKAQEYISDLLDNEKYTKDIELLNA